MEHRKIALVLLDENNDIIKMNSLESNWNHVDTSEEIIFHNEMEKEICCVITETLQKEITEDVVHKLLFE